MDANLLGSFADLHDWYKALPFEWLLVGHCMFAATLAPQFKDKFLLHYWATYLAGFGGGTVSAFLLMNPEKASVAIFASNRVGVTWTICWWLNNYFPRNLVNKVYSFWPIVVICKLCTQLLRIQTMIARVDAAVAVFPGVIAAALILGTIGGSGGKFLSDGIRQMWGALNNPSEATLPTAAFRSSFLLTAIYYFSHHYFGLTTRTEAAGIVITLLMAHTLTSELLGAALDWTVVPFKLLHTISNIPAPEAALEMAPIKAAKPAAAKPAESKKGK